MRKILAILLACSSLAWSSRDFGAAGAGSIWITWTGGPILYNQTNAGYMVWFKHGTHGGTTATNSFLFGHQNAFNNRVNVFMQGVDGKLNALWRSSSGAIGTCTTTNAWDDNNWHRLLVQRNSSAPWLVVYVDGNIECSDSTNNPGVVNAAITAQKWGGNDANDTNGAWGGSLFRGAIVSGTTPSIGQANEFLYTGRYSGTLAQWLDFGITSSELDFSGNGLTGTNSGTTIGTSNPPFFIPGGIP